MDQDHRTIELQRENYLEGKKKNASVIHKFHFEYLTDKYLDRVPQGAGACFYRDKKGEEEGIIINWDFYQKALGEDFIDLIDL